jgi:plastocyanin
MKGLPPAVAVCVVTLGVAASIGGTALARQEAKVHPRTARVTIVNDRKTVGRYAPATITVHRGDHVVFRNASNAPHTVSADNRSFDSGTIFMGKSWTFTSRKAGTFTYFCQFHAGMNGKIVVKP